MNEKKQRQSRKTKDESEIEIERRNQKAGGHPSPPYLFTNISQTVLSRDRTKHSKAPCSHLILIYKETSNGAWQ